MEHIQTLAWAWWTSFAFPYMQICLIGMGKRFCLITCNFFMIWMNIMHRKVVILYYLSLQDFIDFFVLFRWLYLYDLYLKFLCLRKVENCNLYLQVHLVLWNGLNVQFKHSCGLTIGGIRKCTFVPTKAKQLSIR